MHKPLEWNVEKNAWLKQTRGVSFEMVQEVLESGGPVHIIRHPKAQYTHQQMYVLELNGYVCDVPFVEDDEKIFLKTIHPNRKHQNFINPNKNI